MTQAVAIVDLADDVVVPVSGSGDVAHDAADAGNPVKIGGKAETTAPAAVADGDRVNAWFDEYGRLVVVLQDTSGNDRFPAALAANGGLKIEGVAGGVAQPVSGTFWQATQPVADTWRVAVAADTTADDSDKTFTVPAATEWQVLGVLVDYVSTAAAGNRQLSVQVLDGSDNVLGETRAGVVQAASLTRRYDFAIGNPDDAAFRDTTLLQVALPARMLAAGWKVRVYDKAAIAAAADDMTVRLTYAARTI